MFLVEFHAQTDENVNGFFGVTQLGNAAQEFWSERRRFGQENGDHNLGQGCDIGSVDIDFLFLANAASIGLGPSVGEIVSVPIEGDLGRSVAVDDGGFGFGFLVEGDWTSVGFAEFEKDFAFGAVEIHEDVAVVIQLEFELLAQLIVEIHERVKQLIVFFILSAGVAVVRVFKLSIIYN